MKSLLIGLDENNPRATSLEFLHPNIPKFPNLAFESDPKIYFITLILNPITIKYGLHLPMNIIVSK